MAAGGESEASPPSTAISRTPTSRASDAWAVCNSSYQRSISPMGSTSIWANSAPVVSRPGVIHPCRAKAPPIIRTEVRITTWVRLTTGKSTLRSHRVRRDQPTQRLRWRRDSSSRRAPRPCASMVRLASTDSASAAATAA
jgi:hypothetical protein